MNKDYRIFEDFFDDVDRDDIVDGIEDEELFKEEMCFTVSVEITSILEQNKTNFKKIADKLLIILGNSRLFDDVRMKSAFFSKDGKSKYDKSFTYDELPDTPDYIKNTLSGIDKALIKSTIDYVIEFVPGRILGYREFCKELLRIMNNVGRSQITWFPTSNVHFMFEIDEEEVWFGVYNLPIEDELYSIYRFIYSGAAEPSEDERKYTLKERILQKTNIVGIVKESLSCLKEKKSVDIEVIDIDEHKNGLIIFELNMKNYIEAEAKTGYVVDFLKKNIIDRIPNHYLVVRSVCFVVHYPKTLNITDINNRKLDKPFNVVSGEDRRKFVKMDLVELKTKTGQTRTNRFVKVTYYQGDGKVYVMFPNAKGKVAPATVTSSVSVVNYMLSREFK